MAKRGAKEKRKRLSNLRGRARAMCERGKDESSSKKPMMKPISSGGRGSYEEKKASKGCFTKGRH